MAHLTFQPLVATKAEMFSDAPSNGAGREFHSTSEMSETFSEVLKDLLKGVGKVAESLQVPGLAAAAGLALEIFEGLEVRSRFKFVAKSLA
ncbi:hypothetical protein K435DRAFT_868138 [Dendrothele bispora CBS 962.96]|uniref:Uncharacterized protein n=1 Tax=Dendrothele bispora (strain CBS 962.96) TaxID=1314807 RepID=A0A4V6T557_DENBC|nr:hypothetical protein K435DRAFT_868138 [Dendrothele bispora CBS 962.96]